MDAKDILGLHKTSFQEKKIAPKKEIQRKPDGISREVYMLTGGIVSPLVPAVESTQLKKKAPVGNEKVTWQWLPFTSSARTDNLHLYHWVRVVNGVPPTGDYSFAKYNKSLDIVKYTDEEYEKYITDPVWTKEETDQLFQLCERFDLRFVVIADRFQPSRSIEELKSRYYNVCRAILVGRAAVSGEVAEHPLAKESFNTKQETERKRALSMVLSHTKKQERKDAEVLAEAKRIAEARTMERRSAQEAEMAMAVNADLELNDRDYVSELSPSSVTELSASVLVPPTPTADSPIPAPLRMLRVFTRTAALDQMIQAVSSTAGLRTIKRVDQTLQDLGVNIKPKVPTKAVCSEHLELRKEILALLNLQKQLQYKEAEASSLQDGSYPETPDTPMCVQRVQRGLELDRTFVPESNTFGVKREQKRKGPGRYSDAPPSPQSKRARKLKSLD